MVITFSLVANSKPFLLMQHDAIQYDLKQQGTYGKTNVIDSGLGQMKERDGRKNDLVLKGMRRSGKYLARIQYQNHSYGFKKNCMCDKFS
jgi:hypothetical protein